MSIFLSFIITIHNNDNNKHSNFLKDSSLFNQIPKTQISLSFQGNTIQIGQFFYVFNEEYECAVYDYDNTALYDSLIIPEKVTFVYPQTRTFVFPERELMTFPPYFSISDLQESRVREGNIPDITKLIPSKHPNFPSGIDFLPYNGGLSVFPGGAPLKNSNSDIGSGKIGIFDMYYSKFY